MEFSQFKFTAPRLLSLRYSENESFAPNLDNPSIEMPISIIPNVKNSTTETNATVELTVEVGDDSNQTPFFIVLTMGAQFRWQEGAFEPDGLNNLLSKNAVSLLLSYARPIIAVVTSQSRFPTYDLPFLNLTQPD